MAKDKFNNSNVEVAAEDTSKKALSDLSNKADTDKVVIVSEKRKGKTVMGVEKTPVVFDSEGKATVTVKEAKYFLEVPGVELKETKKTAAKEETKEAEADKKESAKAETKETK